MIRNNLILPLLLALLCAACDGLGSGPSTEEGTSPVQVNEHVEGVSVRNLEFGPKERPDSMPDSLLTYDFDLGDVLPARTAEDGLVLAFLESGVVRGSLEGVYPGNLQAFPVTKTRPDKPGKTLEISHEAYPRGVRITFASQKFFNPEQWVDANTVVTLVIIEPEMLPPAAVNRRNFNEVATHYGLIVEE